MYRGAAEIGGMALEIGIGEDGDEAPEKRKAVAEGGGNGNMVKEGNLLVVKRERDGCSGG